MNRSPASKFIFLIFIHLPLSLFPVFLLGQVQKPVSPQLLPFQQNASQPVSDEQLALQLYQNREYDKAAVVYERLYQQKPSSFYYQYLLICLIESKEFGKAERLVKKCQKAEPMAPRYQVDLGYVNYRAGNPEKTRKIYEDALKQLNPSQPQIIELANAFLNRGEYDYAIKTYQKGKLLLNNEYSFGVELASVYERTGDFTNAMEAYLELVEENNTYLNQVQDRLQQMLALDINNEKNEALRKLLLSKTQKFPDKTIYAEMLWWYSVQQKDFELAFIQAKALDRRLQEGGDRLVALANLVVSNEKFDIAIECYQYILSRGPDGPNFDFSRRQLANTRYMKIISEPVPQRKQLELLEIEFQKELVKSGDNPDNITLIRNFAHIKAFYLGKSDEAIDLLNRAIQMPGAQPAEVAKCKIELADILLFTNDVWEATLLYQQAYQDFKTDPLGQEAKFKNAKLSFYIGEFKWAKAQADILKAATSKFISNDAIALSLLISENMDPDSNTVALGIYARAELLDYRNEEEQALTALDSIPGLFGYHPILQHVYYKKGQIMRKQGKYNEADSIFQMIVQDFPGEILADEALMQAALLNEKQLNNREKAMALYQQLIEQYPGSIFVPDARRQFRFLRGDKVQ